MKIPKSILIDPDANKAYAAFAVAVSVFAFAYSSNFGQILILAYYAVWLPLLFVDYRRFTWNLSSAWLPILFAVYVCMSVFWSQAAGTSARAAVQYSSHILCAFVAARTISVRTLVLGSLIGIFFVLLYSLKVGAYALDIMDGTFNFVGAFGSKNQVGFFSSLGIFFSLVFLAFYRRNWMSFFWTAPLILLSVYMLAIAHSATSVASLPAVIGIVALLAMSKVLSRRYRRVLFVVGAGALVAGITAALNLGLLDFVLGLFGKDSTLTGRTYLWEQGWQAAQQRPLLGYGYAAYWVQGFADPERLWAEFYITTRTGFHFHNTYIETLVELGFIGVTMLAFVILRAFYGHVSKVVFGDWNADSVVLAGAIGLMLIRSFFEVELLGPYFTASFIVYYGLFKLAPMPVIRRRRMHVPVQEEKAANGRMPAAV
ncbi:MULTISPECIES: O-antigen ligase [unclassified Mesorhizobium]|uniref:O-antigen ligase family protein n=1 Tax=unclassified Mesorhizobium TaxID=325217 RepID=UPI000BB05719|nr:MULTISPECIES: O-antigen ligase [unclassified Mesorhizobium]TGT60830.1 O-antigen ligase family protein [Mesorhizobium sp. M00.F.Ca.ET.170.01.1.1]AZO10070.1 O-antigen ligase family protein [Mesorhizobium sp. M3A.F.Ca.ET.080.04.2.1]PBB86527.1 exopolysaccharide biosynthesis protein [Mesorhizobium sp. WSM3876]RWE21255.1 MAG: O-antigen ligase family protein [Mesorhizobium sp.]RWE29686.1 MAG: O-antigen ligase family protein [Mesorhizobium sp.]